MNAQEARELFPTITSDIASARLKAARNVPNTVREKIQRAALKTIRMNLLVVLAARRPPRAAHCPQASHVECLWPDCVLIGCPIAPEHPLDGEGRIRMVESRPPTKEFVEFIGRAHS